MTYALVILLTLSPDPPPPTWHASLEECRAHAPALVLHYEVTGRPVASAACQRVRVPVLRAVTGEVVTR